MMPSGSPGSARWLVKPPKLLAMRTRELKTRVVPAGTVLESPELAIEFAS